MLTNLKLVRPWVAMSFKESLRISLSVSVSLCIHWFIHCTCFFLFPVTNLSLQKQTHPHLIPAALITWPALPTYSEAPHSLWLCQQHLHRPAVQPLFQTVFSALLSIPAVIVLQSNPDCLNLCLIPGNSSKKQERIKTWHKQHCIK